jgi:signal-transduction protein with cAMP-binding, CBS, and nucleotidyltransferase domain
MTETAYPELQRMRVVDAMHHGLVSCGFDVPLRTVARMMATFRVHAVLVTAHGDEELPGGVPWGIISDADLLRAAETVDFEEQTARELAVTPALTMAANEGLPQATRMMVESGSAHLIVVDPRSKKPIGVLSSLDVARALARFPEQHPFAR